MGTSDCACAIMSKAIIKDKLFNNRDIFSMACTDTALEASVCLCAPTQNKTVTTLALSSGVFLWLGIDTYAQILLALALITSSRRLLRIHVLYIPGQASAICPARYNVKRHNYFDLIIGAHTERGGGQQRNPLNGVFAHGLVALVTFSVPTILT